MTKTTPPIHSLPAMLGRHKRQCSSSSTASLTTTSSTTLASQVSAAVSSENLYLNPKHLSPNSPKSLHELALNYSLLVPDLTERVSPNHKIPRPAPSSSLSSFYPRSPTTGNDSKLISHQGYSNYHAIPSYQHQKVQFSPLNYISTSKDTFQHFHYQPKRLRSLSENAAYGKTPEANEDFLKEMEPKVYLKGMEPKVYPQRWIQLGYLSLLALLSDWICFAVAAAPHTFEKAYPGHSAARLVALFLFTNVASCFVVTDVVAKFGLGNAIKGASLLMLAGCFLRSGVSFFTPLLIALDMDPTLITSRFPNCVIDGGLASYPLIVAGTILVGVAQPFFQCTPPMLSATWFASDERATSTAVALNFNQIGIATAFLVGGGMASRSADGMADYFSLITAFCVAITAGTLIQFQEKPPTPPSTSEIEKLIKGEKEPPFLDSAKKFFATPGFTYPLAAFICSISITNIVGAFLVEVLERRGIKNQLSIDLVGAGFELSILLGGIFIGGYVDRTKKYKDVTLKCLIVTMFLVIPLGSTDHAFGQGTLVLILSLMGLGIAAGSIQPINAELAVDVVYPGDETAVESVQQIGGNLISAILVPVAEVTVKLDYTIFKDFKYLEGDVRGDVFLLLAVAAATFGYFSRFDAPLRRSIADCADDETCEDSELDPYDKFEIECE